MIITIGREFGSGGRELGRKLAEKLGIAYYDKEIIPAIAKNASVKQVVDRNPHEILSVSVAHTFAYIDTYGIQQKQKIYSEQENVVKKMAAESDCVIVGRCADYILRDQHPFNIFVYANMDSKVKRCYSRMAEGETMPEKKLIKKIKAIEKNREKYYNYYTGRKWGEKLNYDICINTSDANIDEVVEGLAEMLKTKKIVK